jgi:DNA-binding transcriptional regulator GbsR (MarR family)
LPKLKGKMKKEELLERFAITYKNEGYPPLAGKIIGLFYISDEKYLTFNEITEKTGASKGAISKTLQLLLEHNRINYTTEKNGRKRLFYLDIKGLIKFLKMIIKNYEDQNILIEECLELRTEGPTEMNEFMKSSIKFNIEILTFLNQKSEQYFNKN